MSRTVNNPSVVIELNITTFKDSDYNQFIYFKLSTNLTATKIFGTVELAIRTNPRNDLYDLTVFKTSVNYCRLLDGTAGDFLSRTVLEGLKNSGQELFKCPFVAGTYEYKAIPVSDQFFPKFLLLDEMYFRMNCNMKGKLEKSKKMAQFFTLQVMGVINRN